MNFMKSAFEMIFASWETIDRPYLMPDKDLRLTNHYLARGLF